MTTKKPAAKPATKKPQSKPQAKPAAKASEKSEPRTSPREDTSADQASKGEALTGEPLPQDRTTAHDSVESSGKATTGDPESADLGQPREPKSVQDPQPGPGAPADPYREVEYGGDAAARVATRDANLTGPATVNEHADRGPDADPDADDRHSNSGGDDQEAWLVQARFHRREGWSFNVLGKESEAGHTFKVPDLDPDDADTSIGTLWLPRK